MPISKELAALIRRAESATANARRLLDENDRWRRSVEWQLDYLFELSAEFRRPVVGHLPAIPQRPPAGEAPRVARSGRGDAPIRSGSA